MHAPNVHHSGGRQLLVSLLRALEGRHDYRAIVDARLAPPPEINNASLIQVRPTLTHRLAAEMQLRHLTQPGDRVLCFGNLPPLVRLRCRVFLYLQNPYLTSAVPLTGFGWRTRLRITFERLWLRSRLANVNTILVQTAHVQREVTQHLGREALLMPFLPEPMPGASCKRGTLSVPQATFLYVASGEPHKNHMRLIEGWRLLAADGLRPVLLLTLDERMYPDLMREITQAQREHALEIHNLGYLPAPELARRYREADALIYPSTMETFGLPLAEARAIGLPIVAAERDFVRDVLDPEHTFDPESPFSIARAVRRFLGSPEVPQPACGPDEFVRRLLTLGD